MKPNSEQKVVKNLLCACNGLPCKGLCHEKNLYRKRKNKDLDMCPSAYEKEPKYERRKEKQTRDKKWRRQHDE